MSGITPRFFGQYLLEKDVLSKDQLVEAINYQKSKLLKLGEIAVRKGYISDAQAAKINNEQKRTDMRFGDLAIKLGFLDDAQLQELMTIQKNNHIYLGEAIVTCGHLDQETLDNELAKFKSEQQTIPAIAGRICEGVTNRELVEVSVDLTEKLLLRAGDILAKTGEITEEKETIKNLGCMSVIEFTGDIKASYVLNLSWDVGHQIAKRTFKKDDLPFDEELIVDTGSEFVNVVCGNVRARMLELGKNTEIEPPLNYSINSKPDFPLTPGDDATVISGFTPIGNFEIAIINKK